MAAVSPFLKETLSLINWRSCWSVTATVTAGGGTCFGMGSVDSSFAGREGKGLKGILALKPDLTSIVAEGAADGVALLVTATSPRSTETTEDPPSSIADTKKSVPRMP